MFLVLIKRSSLFLSENICYGYALETPNEYQWHMFSWRNKKKKQNNFWSEKKASYLELCKYSNYITILYINTSVEIKHLYNKIVQWHVELM